MSKNNPKISVVIPTYNDSDKLPGSVATVIAQPYDNLEIIIVDDAGSQDVRAVLNKHFPSDSRIVLSKHSENKMLGGARNTGVDISSGDYVFFLDADDRLLETAIPKLVSTAMKTNADVVQGGSLSGAVSECPKPYHAASFVSEGGIEGLNLFASHRYASIAWNKLYRRRFLNEPNPIRFVEKFMHEDVAFAARTAFLAKRIVSISDHVVHYTTNPESLTQRNPTRFNLESYLETYISLINAVEEFGLNEPEHRKLVQRIFASHGSSDFGPKLVKCYSQMGPEVFLRDLHSVTDRKLGMHGIILGDLISYFLSI